VLQTAIKELIEARFDAVSTAVAPEPESSPHKRAATNGASDTGYTDPSASPEPARKKAKRSSSVEDADARLAAQLQAQENSLARSRSTRGGDKVTKKKKAPRKKSAKKVGADDDSDLDGSEGSSAPPKKKAGGGFQKPFLLSPALAELCGETQVCRQKAFGCFYLAYLAPTRPRILLTSICGSCLDQASSRAFGNTSRPMIFKTPVTNARLGATKRCKQSSSRPRSTCSA
jgi:hypothetical protein